MFELVLSVSSKQLYEKMKWLDTSISWNIASASILESPTYTTSGAGNKLAYTLRQGRN